MQVYYYVLCRELLQFNAQWLFDRGSYLAVTSAYVVIDCIQMKYILSTLNYDN